MYQKKKAHIVTKGLCSCGRYWLSAGSQRVTCFHGEHRWVMFQIWDSIKPTSQVLTPKAPENKQTPAGHTHVSADCVLSTNTWGNKRNNKVAALEEYTKQLESNTQEPSRIKETNYKWRHPTLTTLRSQRKEKQGQYLRGIREVGGSIKWRF